MGLWQRFVAMFSGDAPAPRETERATPARSSSTGAAAEAGSREAGADAPIAPPPIQAKPVFSGMVARILEGEVKALVRQAHTSADRQVVSILLRAVKNDGADLPAMPKELLKIQRMLSDVDVQVSKLASAMQRDPMIAAKFLALANSPFYGGRHRITDVQQAIVRLGLSTTQMLITAILARSRVFKIQAHEAEAAELYRHALATAALAQALAPSVGVDEQDAFMAGLFHDLGRVFVLTASGQVRTKDKKSEPPTPEFLARAQDMLDAGFSAMIAESWGYRDSIVQALLHHHEPVPAPGEDSLAFPEDEDFLTYLIAAADQLAFDIDREDGVTREAARQLLDALDIELTEELMAKARGTVETFMAEVGAQAA